MLVTYYWISYTYQCVMILVPYAIEFVYISQIFEWMAMLFVITSQKTRTVDEILYDQ